MRLKTLREPDGATFNLLKEFLELRKRTLVTQCSNVSVCGILSSCNLLCHLALHRADETSAHARMLSAGAMKRQTGGSNPFLKISIRFQCSPRSAFHSTRALKAPSPVSTSTWVPDVTSVERFTTALPCAVVLKTTL